MDIDELALRKIIREEMKLALKEVGFPTVIVWPDKP
jgi:hypothetical protein